MVDQSLHELEHPTSTVVELLELPSELGPGPGLCYTGVLTWHVGSDFSHCIASGHLPVYLKRLGHIFP